MRVLRARLLEIKHTEKEQEIAVLRGEYTKAEWGSQIRSYVLHPYQMVKDHRTEHETGNTQAVLDGKLDEFMEAYLAAGPGGEALGCFAGFCRLILTRENLLALALGILLILVVVFGIDTAPTWIYQGF